MVCGLFVLLGAWLAVCCAWFWLLVVCVLVVSLY